MIKINLSAPISVWNPILLRLLKWIQPLSSYRKMKNIPIRNLLNGLNLNQPKLKNRSMKINVILFKLSISLSNAKDLMLEIPLSDLVILSNSDAGPYQAE